MYTHSLYAIPTVYCTLALHNIEANYIQAQRTGVMIRIVPLLYPKARGVFPVSSLCLSLLLSERPALFTFFCPASVSNKTFPK